MIKAFLMYDYNRMQSFCQLKIDKNLTDTQWNKEKAIIESSLKQVKLNPHPFQFELMKAGMCYWKFDPENRCNIIMLCETDFKTEKADGVLSKVLQMIKEKESHYSSMKIEDFEEQFRNEIRKVLINGENIQSFQPLLTTQNMGSNPYTEKILTSNIQEQEILIQVEKDQSLSPDHTPDHEDAKYQSIQNEFLLVFRAFMMFDYQRQFFFMFIRKGFIVDNAWNKERTEVQKKLMEMEKSVKESYTFEGEFGVYQGLFDKQAKCHFILLSRFYTDEARQANLLKDIFEKISAVPKYIKVFSDVTQLRYDELEHQVRKSVTKILEDHEAKYDADFGKKAKNVEKLGKIFKKIGQQSGQKSKYTSAKNTIILKEALETAK